jgi:hypothetical protein
LATVPSGGGVSNVGSVSVELIGLVKPLRFA